LANSCRIIFWLSVCLIEALAGNVFYVAMSYFVLINLFKVMQSYLGRADISKTRVPAIEIFKRVELEKLLSSITG